MQRVACLALSDDGPHYRAMSEAEVSATLAARRALSSASVAAEKGDFYRAIPTKPTPDLPTSSPRIPLCPSLPLCVLSTLSVATKDSSPSSFLPKMLFHRSCLATLCASLNLDDMEASCDCLTLING
jgi:hypothetical protein